jgi:hypothetical protein
MSDICLSRSLNMVGAPGLDQILGEAEDKNVNKKFVSRAKSASFSSESKFSYRGAAEASKQDRRNYKAKDIIGKIVFFISLLTKLEI